MVGKGSASSRQAAPKGIAGDRGNGAVRELAHERVFEIQRGRLLAALFEVSAERGAGNVAVAHVVERAGVSRRTFYDLFADREDCFLAAFDEAIMRVSRQVLEVYDPQACWAERIRAALVALLEFLDVERVAGQLLIVGSLGAGPRVVESRQRVLAQIATVLDEGHKERKGAPGPAPLTAEGIVGGVLSVLHTRLLASQPVPATVPTTTTAAAAAGASRVGGSQDDSLLALAGPLMAMIVLPYLGPVAARKELARPVPKRQIAGDPVPGDPLRDVGMRLTYRTVRVLLAIAANPGSSNREIGANAGTEDQGQISKLLARLQRLELIQNTHPTPARGAPNAWSLTERGWNVQHAIAGQATR